ncbi:hypothetical protein ALNOE001_08180 [Candidatus Methanobinarius endosymbioticus]|uniref:Uncharacterized protein n=1 Tax=Candidatus Methanobinarius endosymbioticus TaxID=2006182 RepID=A0A366MDC2_9EURY|nr:hypothetical protein ALNOE001_08180 [Candidatus Methanobinarius endosymbioticus]
MKEYNSSSVNLTVNYNRVLADIWLDFTTTDVGSNFAYNWWRINDISGKVIGFDTNNHYILNITNSSLANVKIGDKIEFALLMLNTTLTNIGVENLPYFKVNGTFNGINYSTTTDDLFLYEFIISGTDLQRIDAESDWQYLELDFTVKLNTNSTIITQNTIVNKSTTI